MREEIDTMETQRRKNKQPRRTVGLFRGLSVGDELRYLGEACTVTAIQWCGRKNRKLRIWLGPLGSIVRWPSQSTEVA